MTEQKKVTVDAANDVTVNSNNGDITMTEQAKKVVMTASANETEANNSFNSINGEKAMTEQAKKVTVKTIKNFIITSTILKYFGAYKSSIKFFEKNFPESLFPKGLNLSEVKVTGDYRNFFHWIENLSGCKFEYDEDDNLIKPILPDGTVHEYDRNGFLIRSILPNGYIINIDKSKILYSNGDIEENDFKYDDKGRLIQADKCIIEYLE